MINRNIMKNILSIIAIAGLVVGCASTKSTVSKAYTSSKESQLSISVQKSSDVSIPDEQYQLLESQIKNGLAANGLLASGEQNSQHSVTVEIHSFRMRDDAARLTVGIMAGCDNIVSTVVVTDKVTREELGRSQVSIKECAAWGVASQVIKKYTDGVVAYLSKK